MTRKIKFTKQYKPMGFSDKDDRDSVEAHLRAKEQAKDMRRFNKRMKELEAEDARRRDSILTRVMGFFCSQYGTR
ncbi:hypothetical protein [Tunturiibacter lichenicola]|uniref:hypothetical protein n=1 Tax=Tunturiibacter lichenicola TaxID=2051959 RepID=UPI0021B4868D|nr:hypothetical protein [Edaphobacter lichenicola]